MAGVEELSGPIIYLNAGALAASLYAFVKLRRLAAEGKADGAWAPFLGVIVAGTSLHFLGDVIDLPWSPEETDHILIHTTLLIALVVLIVQLVRGRE